MTEEATSSCTLRFELSLESASVLAPELREAFRTRALSLLCTHGLGPSVWTHDGTVSSGTWNGHHVRADIFTARDTWVRATLRWDLRLPLPFIDPLVRYVRELLGAVSKDCRVRGIANVRPEGVLHRAPAPQREALRSGALLEIYDPQEPAWRPGTPTGYDAPLPPPATRETTGTVHFLRWARDPLTLDEIQRAVLAQEDWFLAHADYAPPDPDEWNALGDRVVLADLGEELDVRWDGSVDEARFAELVDRAATSPITIICPSRRSALAIHPRAVAAGIDVIYRRHGRWDPFPAGYVPATTPQVERERNDRGERRVETEGLVQMPPLTAYDFETGEGHKALAVTNDGSTDETLLVELLALRDAGKLPNGHPLTSIVVITTSRASALAFAPRARTLGLRVAYLDDDRLWEVT